MPVQAGISQVAAALADPAREALLAALADGRALPAGELANIAGISPQSASFHLQKLVECRLLTVWSQGKFRYYRLAGDAVAEVLETLANFARAAPPGPARRLPLPPDLAIARSCYSHLAGKLGVRLAELLAARGFVRIEDDSAHLTDRGREWAASLSLLEGRRAGAKPEVRLCLDWTERRHHLAGRVPSALLHYLIERGHLRRRGDRSLKLTPSGEAWFAALAREGRSRATAVR